VGGSIVPAKRTKTPEVREWRASIIRKRLERLGRVVAPDREAAEAAAVQEFGLADHERGRLVVQEIL
jgi:hypothetical protein